MDGVSVVLPKTQYWYANLHRTGAVRQLLRQSMPCLAYAEKLTLTPAAMYKSDVTALRAAGFSDAGILDINQVTGYFAYVNRLADGLGDAARRFLADG